MSARFVVAAAAAVTAAAAILFGGAFRGGAIPAATQAASGRAAAESFQTSFAASDTEAIVARLQAELRQTPDDPHALALLGLGYQQRARETGDPAYYTKSAQALRRALALAPGDLTATSGFGSLALSRHRFREALALARRAQRLSPSTSLTYGVIGDALVELGRYREGFAAFDRMVTLKPGLAAYARVAHARELLGDIRGARRALLLARDTAQGQAEPTAWTEWQLGKLAFGHGKYTEAERRYEAALAALPGYVYALDALAALRAAQGRFTDAIALERRATDTIPLPQFVAQLGDLYRVTGRERLAHEQYATIAVIEQLLHANGVRTDLETALLDADHGGASVPLARRAQRDRPSIDGDDVLAWTLYRSGQCAEAQSWSRRALRLGTKDALKFFHRAAIDDCLGRRAGARRWARRALALNPHFSLLWTPTARRLAAP
jgi:tetratricopeptide (TPR) repeat protein